VDDKKTGGTVVVRIDLLTHNGNIPAKSGQAVTIVAKKELFVFSQ
jgi:hypothetical protein